MSRFKKGDLAYLPSQVRLIQTDLAGNPVKHKVIEKPQNVLVIGAEDTTLVNSIATVLCDGEHWHTPMRNLYPIMEVSCD